MTDDGFDLVVEFLGDERVLAPGDELTFGRAGDLRIDDNRYLHRLVGRFTWANGMWWISNVGSSIAVQVADAAGLSYAKVAPGSSVPLSFETSRLTFEAGASKYELTAELLVDAPFLHVDDEVVDRAEVTTTAASLPLNAEQRLLLVALAAPKLRHGDAELPTNRQVAAQLGWTITKFNRKLDGLCRKYAAAGVSGLRGSSDLLARDRRVRLVEHVLTAGVIDDRDLVLLERE